MGTKRHSKTASQQCRYYEVDNIFEYMVDTYINGNITSFKDIYRELNKGARRDFVDFIFNEANPWLGYMALCIVGEVILGIVKFIFGIIIAIFAVAVLIGTFIWLLTL